MDAVLHAQRLDHGGKRLHPLSVPLRGLPDGAMVAAGRCAYLVRDREPYLWEAAGYRQAAMPERVDGVLTPPATLAALAAGYRPVIHPSAGG